MSKKNIKVLVAKPGLDGLRPLRVVERRRLYAGLLQDRLDLGRGRIL